MVKETAAEVEKRIDKVRKKMANRKSLKKASPKNSQTAERAVEKASKKLVDAYVDFLEARQGLRVATEAHMAMYEKRNLTRYVRNEDLEKDVAKVDAAYEKLLSSEKSISEYAAKSKKDPQLLKSLAVDEFLPVSVLSPEEADLRKAYLKELLRNLTLAKAMVPGASERATTQEKVTREAEKRLKAAIERHPAVERSDLPEEGEESKPNLPEDVSAAQTDVVVAAEKMRKRIQEVERAIAKESAAEAKYQKALKNPAEFGAREAKLKEGREKKRAAAQINSKYTLQVLTWSFPEDPLDKQDPVGIITVTSYPLPQSKTWKDYNVATTVADEESPLRPQTPPPPVAQEPINIFQPPKQRMPSSQLSRLAMFLLERTADGSITDAQLSVFMRIIGIDFTREQLGNPGLEDFRWEYPKTAEKVDELIGALPGSISAFTKENNTKLTAWGMCVTPKDLTAHETPYLLRWFYEAAPTSPFSIRKLFSSKVYTANGTVNEQSVPADEVYFALNRDALKYTPERIINRRKKKSDAIAGGKQPPLSPVKGLREGSAPGEDPEENIEKSNGSEEGSGDGEDGSGEEEEGSGGGEEGSEEGGGGEGGLPSKQKRKRKAVRESSSNDEEGGGFAPKTSKELLWVGERPMYILQKLQWTIIPKEKDSPINTGIGTISVLFYPTPKGVQWPRLESKTTPRLHEFLRLKSSSSTPSDQQLSVFMAIQNDFRTDDEEALQYYRDKYNTNGLQKAVGIPPTSLSVLFTSNTRIGACWGLCETANLRDDITKLTWPFEFKGLKDGVKTVEHFFNPGIVSDQGNVGGGVVGSTAFIQDMVNFGLNPLTQPPPLEEKPITKK